MKRAVCPNILDWRRFALAVGVEGSCAVVEVDGRGDSVSEGGAREVWRVVLWAEWGGEDERIWVSWVYACATVFQNCHSSTISSQSNNVTPNNMPVGFPPRS